MILFPRDINRNQLGVRSLFGWFCVVSYQENACNLFFLARKMFLYFFLHKIQWGIQWYHHILLFTTALLKKCTKTKCNMLQNFENFLKTKSVTSHYFYRLLRKVRGILKSSGHPVLQFDILVVKFKKDKNVELKI